MASRETAENLRDCRGHLRDRRQSESLHSQPLRIFYMRHLISALIFSIIIAASVAPVGHAQPATITSTNNCHTGPDFLPVGIPKLPRVWKATYQTYSGGALHVVEYKNGGDTWRNNSVDTHWQVNTIDGSPIHFQWADSADPNAADLDWQDCEPAYIAATTTVDTWIPDESC